MELLDTSALIDCFTGRRASLPRLVTLLEGGTRLGMTSLTLYEWRRGDRTSEELRDQQRLLPDAGAILFGPEEAAPSAELFRQLPRPRAQQMDIAIAANRRDFADIPGLRLV